MNRRLQVWFVVGLSLFSVAIGWALGQRIQSPGEAAQNAEAPQPSLVTVSVEETVLTAEVVIRGQVLLNESAELFATSDDDGATIVTRVNVGLGDSVEEGNIPFEVAGRPLFLLQGELPVFRSLTPGAKGPDVQQLETSLVRLGFDPGTVDQTYDSRTEEAVASLYRSAGYTPDEPSIDEVEQLSQAQQRVLTATETLRTTSEATSIEGIPESTRLTLDEEVRLAKVTLTSTVAERDHATAPTQEAVNTAAVVLKKAEGALELARTRLASAESGVHPDTGLPSTAAELQHLLDDEELAQMDLGRAAQELVSKQEAHDAVAVPFAEAIKQAEIAVAITMATRDETFASLQTPEGTREAVALAATELELAKESLGLLQSRIGVSFPSNELVFMASLPRTVEEIQVGPGDTPEDSVMTLSGIGITILSSVPTSERSLISVGDEGLIEDPESGLTTSVVVEFISESPGGPDAPADSFAVRLAIVGDAADTLLGQNLRVSIIVESSGGPVLAVPLAALSARADGSSLVRIEQDDGAVTNVEVSIGLLSKSTGLVEISPVVPGSVAIGDQVIIGSETPGQDPASTGDEGD